MCHSSYRRAPLKMLERGIFARSPRGVMAGSERTPRFRRAFAARSPFATATEGAAARPGPPPQNLSGDEHMTSFIYKNCTVGEVTGMSDLGFGVNILNERGQPILSLSFRTRDDAAQARAEIAKAVAKAVEVTRPALTAAGEP